MICKCLGRRNNKDSETTEGKSQSQIENPNETSRQSSTNFENRRSEKARCLCKDGSDIDSEIDIGSATPKKSNKKFQTVAETNSVGCECKRDGRKNGTKCCPNCSCGGEWNQLDNCTIFLLQCCKILHFWGLLNFVAIMTLDEVLLQR